MIPKLSESEREEFVSHCLSLIGTPFKHRGRTTRGLDCAGLPALAFARLGYLIFDIAAYGRNPHLDGLRDAIAMNLGEPVNGPPLPGDVLLMRWDDGPPRHIAVVIPHPNGLGIVHTCARFRRVIAHSLDTTWLERIASIYRP